jgi:tight adherence protein B
VTAVLIAVAVGAATFVVARWAAVRAHRSALRRRVAGQLRPASTAAAREADGPQLIARLERLFAGTESRLGRTSLWLRLEELLERAGVSRRPAEVVWLVAAVLCVVALVAAAAAGAAAGLLLALLLVPASGYAYLQLRARRRLAAFDEQLPELLRDVAGSLRAGHSLTQALEAVASEAPAPAREELGRALGEMRLGRGLDEALETMTLRLPSKELRYVLTAITIQRQVGGSLASLFELVTDTVYQRQRFERKVRSLTASGRLSAVVLIGLPFAMAALLELLNPSYLRPLAHGIGPLLVGTGVVMMTIGGMLLKRIVSVQGVSA